MMGIKLHPGEHFTDLCTIQEEDNDEDSRVAFPIIERMEGEARLSRRSSDSDSLNSSYKVSCLSLQNCPTLVAHQVLPPIKRPEHETQSESESDFGREEDLRDFCTTRMRFISERGLGMVLTELRKIDRYEESQPGQVSCSTEIERGPCPPKLFREFWKHPSTDWVSALPSQNSLPSIQSDILSTLSPGSQTPRLQAM